MNFDVDAGHHYQRGHFRLHPPRPDGSGISEGCITFSCPVTFTWCALRY
ncbi:tlde1 domain-containing protein [Enterobacter sp. 638]